MTELVESKVGKGLERQAANENDVGGSNSSDSEISSPLSEKPQRPIRRVFNRQSSSTLVERSRIPASMYLIAFVFVTFESFNGVFPNLLQVAKSWCHSMSTSYVKAWKYLEYVRDIMSAAFGGEDVNTRELLFACTVCICVVSIFIVLVWSPFRAGMWTGQKARKHSIHRYMGLFWMIQYAAAWIEYLTDYEQSKESYLPHSVALNGLIQAVSAYFSFRVLPDATDPGFFSDKAVLSRTFVHENAYFQFLTWVGSITYHDTMRAKLYRMPLAAAIHSVFIFWPFIVIRPFFPKTSMANAGLARKGRTQENELFYKIGTIMVKIFYLWGKFFLGLYINQLVILGRYTDDDMKFIRGLFILNMGTVSIPVFLHTLRFKKVLQPRLAFGIYLSQAYASFSAIPYAWNLFSQHQLLCALMLLGLALNFTRSLTIHGLWCALCLYLEKYSGLQF